jgi:transposase InsO family protein
MARPVAAAPEIPTSANTSAISPALSWQIERPPSSTKAVIKLQTERRKYDVDGFLKGKRYLIHDRDPLYTREFLSMLADAGIESVKLPPRSPNLNAHAERFVRAVKEECLEQMIFFGEDSLWNSIHQFLDHYHLERNHQGLNNRLIIPMKGKVKLYGRFKVPVARLG